MAFSENTASFILITNSIIPVLFQTVESPDHVSELSVLQLRFLLLGPVPLLLRSAPLRHPLASQAPQHRITDGCTSAWLHRNFVQVINPVITEMYVKIDGRQAIGRCDQFKNRILYNY